MSTSTLQVDRNLAHTSLLTLAIGFVLSIILNLGAGIGVSGYYRSMSSSAQSSSTPIELMPDAMNPPPRQDQVHLGANESSQASIHWLGVVENPEPGDAQVAEVEQAAFTQSVGNGPESAPAAVSQVPLENQSQQPPEQQVQQVVQEQADQNEEESSEQAMSPLEAPSEQLDLEIKPIEDAETSVEIQPDPVEKPGEAEPTQEPVDEDEEVEPELPIGPSLVSVDPTPTTKPETKPETEPETEPEQAEQQVQSPSVQPPAPATEASSPKAVGKEGILSKRESTASIIKRAIKVDAHKLNRPIVGQGLEITTVDPRFPATVRFTQLPRNPVILIRFDASGRVVKVRFLSEGRRVFDTGARAVDEPLLNAVYKWRAKGKEIDALDPNDPDSTIEISMRILFRKDSSVP